jgi:signal transduction histidine kinase
MRRKMERLEQQRALERERARIAKDIHDDLGASLTRIILLSQSAKADLETTGNDTGDLDRIFGTARELTRAMDEIVWAVNPTHDTLDSLAGYLGKFAQDYLRAANIRCRLRVPMQLPPWPLTAEVRHNLFLAVKEALHNVVKHSGASEVSINLTIEQSGFSLAVEDNGRGFDVEAANAPDGNGSANPDRIESGNGLANMRRRLAEIGGSCEIRSAPQQGTCITFGVGVAARSSRLIKTNDVEIPTEDV